MIGESSTVFSAENKSLANQVEKGINLPGDFVLNVRARVDPQSGSTPSSRSRAARRSARSACLLGKSGLFLGESDFLVGEPGFLVGPLALRVSPLNQLRVSQKWLAIGADDSEVVWSLTRLEANFEQRALETIHLCDLFEDSGGPQPANEVTAVRVVKIVFFNAMTLVELELAFHLSGTVAG